MNSGKGKMIGLLFLIVLVLFMAYALIPLGLAPMGLFSGLHHGFKGAFVNGIHPEPSLLFFPLWSFSLFFFIIWIAIVIWVFRDAEQRGMSGILWALLVLIGNLIGLLIYLIMRQEHASSHQEQTVQTRQTVTCHSCAKILDKDFIYCPHCGTGLQQTCAQCSKPIESAWKVCPHCGKSLKTN